MRNKVLGLAAVTMLMAVSVCGCQKAPEGSEQGGILYAKDSIEDEVAAIVNEPESAMENHTQEINSTIGTGGNAIRIQAQMPNIPQNVYHITLGENETLTKDVLTEFLGSGTGNIKDLSEEAQKEMEQFKTENEQSEERVVVSVFGSAPIYRLSDGERTAEFDCGTSASYLEETFYQKCASAYKSAEETVLEEAGDTALYRETEKTLLEKLSKIGVEEIDIYKMTRYRTEGSTFYEIEFTPSFEGIGIAHGFGQVAVGEVFPSGKAWVSEGKIAWMSLNACLGKVKEQQKCESVLSWGQVEEILETYLVSGKIIGSKKVVLTNVEFLYYPVFGEAENQLELVPIWRIYTPLHVWAEDEGLVEAFAGTGAAWSICVDAVSGEIIRSE